MERRKGEPVRARTKGLDYRPFRALAGKVRVGARQEKTSRPEHVTAAAVTPVAQQDDARLFLEEMSTVVPLDAKHRERVSAPPPGDPTRSPLDENAEALAELSDLVTGRAAFDIADTDEYIEGFVHGLDPRLVRRLRQGEFAAQGHVDLHGMTADQARLAVEEFLQRSHRAGRRCVLVVHGKGKNSKDQIPVLKTRLKSWLARGRCSRLVLAFTSARPCDGGSGAVYVLLRRQQSSKRKIHVLEGAKS